MGQLREYWAYGSGTATCYQTYSCPPPAADPGSGQPVPTGSNSKPKPTCNTNCTGTPKPKPAPKPIATVEDDRTKGVNGATATSDPTAPVILAALAAAVVATVDGTEAAPAPEPQTATDGASRGGGKQPPECRNNGGLPDDPNDLLSRLLQM